MSKDKIIAMIVTESGLPANKVASTVGLIDDDKTIPFIARYRKEVTGELDEVQIRRIDELLSFYRSLEQKKEEVIRHIEEQGKLTAELKREIQLADTKTRLEDLYLPYKQKRRTRAMMAKEKVFLTRNSILIAEILIMTNLWLLLRWVMISLV